MDNKFNTVHIVAELAIVSGLFYYFNKKVTTLEKEIEHMKKTYVDTFDDVYQKLELMKAGIIQLKSVDNMLKVDVNRDVNRDRLEKREKKVEQVEKEKREVRKVSQDNKEVKEIRKVEQEVHSEKKSPTFIQIETFTVPNIKNDFYDFLQTPNKDEPAKVEILDDEEEEYNKDEKQESNENLDEKDIEEINKLLENNENNDE